MNNMSEARKSSDGREPEARANRPSEHADQTATAPAESSRKAPEARSHNPADIPGQVANDDRTMGWMGAGTAARSAQEASQLIWRAAEESRQMAMKAFEDMARLGVPVAGIGFGKADRTNEDAASVTDAYRRATDDAGDNVRAIFASCSQFGDGLQRMQKACIDVMTRSMAPTRRQPADLLRCKTPAEFVEVQNGLYADGVAFMVDSSTTLLRVAGEVMQDMTRPLQAQAEKTPPG